ncbi:histone-lysine N-methyltransferase SETDB1-B isoform X2 [Bacillus rossius redtenbacheri]
MEVDSKHGSNTPVEIILDSDEEAMDSSSSGGRKQLCCNYDCTSGKNLSVALSFALSYYNIEDVDGKQRKICAKCLQTVLKHQEEMVATVVDRIPLLTLPVPPNQNKIVLSDSEEEDTEPSDEALMSPELMHHANINMNTVVREVYEEYNMDYQISEGKRILADKVEVCKAKVSKVARDQRKIQETINQVRKLLYEGYIPQYRELPPLEIMDVQEEHDPIGIFSVLDSSPTPVPTATVGPSNLSFPALRKHLKSSSEAILQKKYPQGVAMKKVRQVRSTVSPKVNRADLEIADIVPLEHEPGTQKRDEHLPPFGPLIRPRPEVGDVMYVMKLSFYGVWLRARVIDVMLKGSKGDGADLGQDTFKVKFETSKSTNVKVVTGKQLAYPTPSPVRLNIGTRVIAVFVEEDYIKECYYAGVIAEPLKPTNNYRYLVFFDDGYAKYVPHDKVLLVYESSECVWDDMHPDSRDFVRKYLEQYPERPMVRLQKGQFVKTEWNGKWWLAEVVEIDCSLAKMHFLADQRTEWIYRGSTRLGPLYVEMKKASLCDKATIRHRTSGMTSLRQRNLPYVEYTNHVDGEEDKAPGPIRAVAKKSTIRLPNNLEQSLGKATYPRVFRYDPGVVLSNYIEPLTKPKKFVPHQCSEECLSDVYDLLSVKGNNPLQIPIYLGWERHIIKYPKNSKIVMYTAPCGRRLRNYNELLLYLRHVKSALSVDMFDFDHWVNIDAEYQVPSDFIKVVDLSVGVENVPIPCVNYVDDLSLPDYVRYTAKREPAEGVFLNTSENFLIGCDCEDNCSDHKKCACWQLTIEGAKNAAAAVARGGGGMVDKSMLDQAIGYVWKRLPDTVPTGIYECNSRCKCSDVCSNRVVQLPLQQKLQVFKTENRGWGIRCINDIPKGAFICIYAGQLLTEQAANEGGINCGDEYLAELDFIEVVERFKAGYESDVVDDGSASDEDFGKMLVPARSRTGEVNVGEDESMHQREGRDTNRELRLATRRPSPSSGRSSIKTRLRKRTDREMSDDSDSRGGEGPTSEYLVVVISDDEDESTLQQREPSKFAVTGDTTGSSELRSRHRSVRDFYFPDSFCYVMDAKITGNIGRYINHSCSPNVFVQNVFVDTHDLRFPWVAFFAINHIRAGSELTWDYNYDIGSVPGKELTCLCGSKDCRGRLL